MTKKHMPKMLSVMVPFPYSITSNAALTDAEAMMKQHNIHHLPVVDNEDIIGIISARDLLKAVSLGHKLDDIDGLEVGDLVTHRAYMVDINDPLSEVLTSMVDNHIGSAIVLREGDIAGIFTAIDALHHHIQLLQSVFNPDTPDDLIA